MLESRPSPSRWPALGRPRPEPAGPGESGHLDRLVRPAAGALAVRSGVLAWADAARAGGAPSGLLPAHRSPGRLAGARGLRLALAPPRSPGSAVRHLADLAGRGD